jgi:predicted O-linked N-acetylglucosamine transferase (SPINDLY family)/predicted SAM-dependent methyltransferase
MSLFGRLVGRAPQASRAPNRETLEKWLRDAYDHAAKGNHEEARRRFESVLEHDPACPEALYYLGSEAGNEGRHVEAIHFYQKAVDARPNDAAFWFALAGSLFNLGRPAEAIAAFQGGLKLHPDAIDMAGSMWMAMLLDDHDEEARLAVEQARDAGLESPQIDADLGAIYRDHGRVEESIAAYRRVVERTPHDAANYSNMLFMLSYDERQDAAALYAEHRKYAAQFARPYLAPPPDRTWPRKLRIGYVSGDFRKHVVAFFIEPVLENHDRERFEVFCYYTHKADDSYTARLRGLADHWVECEHFSDAELADRIREDRVDILVDLSGHTAHNRMLVFSMKPAPVQVSYLGYPSTAGLAAIDYRITDARADPPGEADAQSAERLVRLPDCFHCFRPRADSPAVGPLPAATAGQITFGCFNNLTKLSPSFLDAAARVVAAVPGSRLWLKGKGLAVPYVAERVRQKFVQAGVDPVGLKLTGWKKTLEDHLAAYNSVDIALDSFPYNGTTTTCEALWMGVPVVTLVGDRHAARVGNSLLHAVGLEELVTRSVDGYVKASAALAADLGRLSELRATLRERLSRSPLTDERKFTRNLEQRYIEMWEAMLQGDAAARSLDAQQTAELLALGTQLRASGKAAEAMAAYKQVLLGRPDHPEALAALWDLSFETGNPGSGIDWLNKAIAVRGDVASFHYMLGCSFQAQRKIQDAIASFSRSLELDPGLAKAHNNLGCTLEIAGDLQGAMHAYVRAGELDPKLAVAFYNRGNLFRRLGDFVQAAEAIGHALSIEPEHAEWRSNLADMFYQRLRLDDAISSYRMALAIDPRLARAWAGLGLALILVGQPAEAEASFRKALELEPRYPEANSTLLLSLHYLRAEERQQVFDAHVRWARLNADRSDWQAARTPEERRRKGRLRIGYLSADFQRHPVAYFIEPVIAAHDRSKVHVFGYSAVSFPDEVTQRFQSLCEEWRDISGLSDSLIAERMRFDGIDILVDMAGHTEGGRVHLLARKPAPVLVTWLGYPNTTGLAAVDYRLTDAYADPPGDSDRFHTEKLVRLRAGFLCYQPPGEAPDVAEGPSRKSGNVTFGSFNNLAKLPSMVPLWARLLQAVPEAKLLLKSYGLSAESARQATLAAFAVQGIAAERLILLPPEKSQVDHLGRYAEVDIALDSFPYNGTTTTCEALWMGVPVVTLAGKSHVSRVGGSILSRVGLGDLVAGSEEAYLEKAIALAKDAERRSELRRGLRQRLEASALLDAAAFARGLEAAYADMWATYAQREDRSVRLHIAGSQKMPGWKILAEQPGPDVDYVGEPFDLSQFADGSVDELYVAHALARLDRGEPLRYALKEFNRVLKAGGKASISVPDAGVLQRLLLDPQLSEDERSSLKQSIAGGQRDSRSDELGLDFEYLGKCLAAAGFSKVDRCGDFGLFHDASRQKFNGVPISLNLVAYR